MTRLLTEVSNDPGAPADTRFWTLDTLAYWYLQRRETDIAAGLVEQMEKLAAEIVLSPRGVAALAIKQQLLAGARGDVEAAARATEQILNVSEDPAIRRVARYDYAVALLQAGRHEEAADLAIELIPEYFAAVGFNPPDLVGLSAEALHELVQNRGSDLDDVRHAADVLDLVAAALVRSGRPSGLARFQAMKLYFEARAFRSAVRAGQDVAHEFVVVQKDAVGAVQLLAKTLLPAVLDLGLVEFVVPVRSQLAWALAYAGDFEAARGQLDVIDQYSHPIDDLQVSGERAETELMLVLQPPLD